jgi:N-acetylmuramoyl-L-alanine amidase
MKYMQTPEQPAPTPPPAPKFVPRPRRQSSPRALQTTFAVAIVLATLFTAWTPAGLFSGNLSDRLALLLTEEPALTPLPGQSPQTQIKIGIVAGHWGNDSGAVCPNGTTEAEVNLRTATLVQQKLNALGVQTDLLKEFDPRLQGYEAATLISIHNDSCDFVNEEATGFKVASAKGSRDINRANRLTACLTDRYGRTTGLPFHPGSITGDMTDYHAFSEINSNTIAAIIETGFLNKDYDILTQQPDLVAQGVVNGILCFINNESIQPTPSAP